MVHRFFSVFFFLARRAVRGLVPLWARRRRRERFAGRRMGNKTVLAMIITVLVQGKCTTWSYLERGDA